MGNEETIVFDYEYIIGRDYYKTKKFVLVEDYEEQKARADRLEKEGNIFYSNIEHKRRQLKEEKKRADELDNWLIKTTILSEKRLTRAEKAEAKLEKVREFAKGEWCNAPIECKLLEIIGDVE